MTKASDAKAKSRVLVVDDEKNLTFIVKAVLERAGFEVMATNDPLEARKIIESDKPIDTLVTDLYMPGLDGMGLLKVVQSVRPNLPVVMITAYGTVEAAVSALKQGAFDFITKPFDQAELLRSIEKAVATAKEREKDLESSVNLVADETGPEVDSVFENKSSIIGSSQAIQDVFRVIRKIAASPTTVLIWGESGTGKELVALEIHSRSDRKDKTFIKINCAAIPATLIESELFGHEKGAFTGAVTSKPGRFELADEGTLFLDEVAEMPLEMQVKLLRALQEQEFERVGGVSTIKVNVRIIAATNKDLENEVKLGRFREDLFYRLNVVPIHLPPLRDRKNDIELIVKKFIGRFNEKLKKKIDKMSPTALMALKNFSWPGNIRQLENAVERMILMCESDVLDVRDLPEDIASVSGLTGAMKPIEESALETSSFKEIVKRQTQVVERELIERALDETAGNVTKAADKLGLSRKGLQIKMKDLGMRKTDDEKLDEKSKDNSEIKSDE